MTNWSSHSMPVKPEWVDAYGHMGGFYYPLAFEPAGWAWTDHFGIGADYFRRTGCGLYTVEAHLRFLKEVRGDATIDIEVLLLGTDAKRNWMAMVMIVDGVERATIEFVDIHFDTKTGRATALPPEVQNALKKVQVTEPPVWAGRGINFWKR